MNAPTSIHLFRQNHTAVTVAFHQFVQSINGVNHPSGAKRSVRVVKSKKNVKKPNILEVSSPSTSNLSAGARINVSTSGSVGYETKAQPKRPPRGEIEGEEKSDREVNVHGIYQNGDPLGRRELGKSVVRWIGQAMLAMASDFASAEVQGDFSELRQRMGPGPTFVIQAQPYLNAVPMPLGLEAVCLKASTHYPTLFDHFQRELRDVLQNLESKSLFPDWRETQSWKLLKELAHSAQHKAIARKINQPKAVQGVLGMDLEKAKAIQNRIDEFANRMSELLRIERDSELEFTQEELNAVPTPDEGSENSKPIEFLVSHGQAQQEHCDTICNLNAVSTSTGLGGMHLVLFRVEGNHRLPPTTLSPGDMVCVRVCDSRGAGATSCMQGFVNNLGDDGCSISVALESRHGDPTFSKLFGKSVRIDRIPGLADTLTYERNCEALMLLQRNGLSKKNPSIAVVATLFGDEEDIKWMEDNNLIDLTDTNLNGIVLTGDFDDSQKGAISQALNKKRPILIIQGPPGTGKTGLLKELIALAVQQGERVLVTAPTNAAVDNLVEKLSNIGINIVRVGNPARISSSVASKSLAKIVNSKLASFRTDIERKKADLRKDLRHCLKDDSLAAGIRQLLKQLGKTLKKKEKEIVKEVLSSAQVVLATNTGAADPLVRRLEKFDLVVIDEAGQAIEPACWIPILQGRRCILAGDQCQLAPVILSRKALEGGLGVSLLERASTLHQGALTTMLTMQYRMNDAIASWASKEMYDGMLKSSPTVSSHLLVNSPFVKPTWITQCPLLLLDTRMPYGSLSVGCEEHLDPAGTGSLYNEGEADIVVQHVCSLIYSGFRGNAELSSFWLPVIERIQQKLHNWKYAFISKGGRLTLIQSVLSSMPTYYFSIFKLPSLIASSLDKLVRNFFWEGSRGEGGLHNVNWRQTQLPKLMGGLDIGNFQQQNLALLAKWNWRFVHEINALWRKVIMTKFYSTSLECWPRLVHQGSSKSPWRFICSTTDFISSRAQRRLGNGVSTSFWLDSWMDCGILASVYPRLFRLTTRPNLRVFEAWVVDSHA